jgi:hypothetical protein
MRIVGDRGRFSAIMCISFRVVENEEKEVASAMMGAFLGIGLASGAALSLYMVKAL